MVQQHQSDINYYDTLGVSSKASQEQVKRAYRKLAKELHPDRHKEASHDKIAAVNAAYEVLGDAGLRRAYDNERRLTAQGNASNRSSRAASSQAAYKKRRKDGNGTTIEDWMRRVFNPTDRLIGQILKPLKAEVRALSADPFDDELMEAFQGYLERCREALEKAQAKFKSMPNPPGMAGGAANLYYCLNQLEDGIEEIERFTYTYDESYLHTGQELFRISAGLRKEAKAEIKAVL